MVNEEHHARLKQGVKAGNEWRKAGGYAGTHPDFAGADLSRSDFSRTDLSGTNLLTQG
jgi:hypothetical protein